MAKTYNILEWSLAEQGAAADRGRITAFRGSLSFPRPRLLSLVFGDRETAAVEDSEPTFAIGQRVRVILNERNRTPHEGTIRCAIWHHKEQRFHYYLDEGGRKVAKRYAAEDLQPIT